MKVIKVVTNHPDDVVAYLPQNYRVLCVGQAEEHGTNSVVYVIGEDNAGWTAEGYVIPRLASGMMNATLVSATLAIDWYIDVEATPVRGHRHQFIVRATTPELANAELEKQLDGFDWDRCDEPMDTEDLDFDVGTPREV